jgi:hypothetical protein
VAIERAFTPTTDAARAEFEMLLEQYARQIPTENGINAWLAYRNMIGQMFPGQMPAPAAIAIMTVVAANAISSLSDQMESALEFDTPGAQGRRQATAAYFERILNHASELREGERLRRLILPGNSVN